MDLLSMLYLLIVKCRFYYTAREIVAGNARSNNLINLWVHLTLLPFIVGLVLIFAKDFHVSLYANSLNKFKQSKKWYPLKDLLF